MPGARRSGFAAALFVASYRVDMLVAGPLREFFGRPAAWAFLALIVLCSAMLLLAV